MPTPPAVLSHDDWKRLRDYAETARLELDKVHERLGALDLSGIDQALRGRCVGVVDEALATANPLLFRIADGTASKDPRAFIDKAVEASEWIDGLSGELEVLPARAARTELRSDMCAWTSGALEEASRLLAEMAEETAEAVESAGS